MFIFNRIEGPGPSYSSGAIGTQPNIYAFLTQRSFCKVIVTVRSHDTILTSTHSLITPDELVMDQFHPEIVLDKLLTVHCFIISHVV